MIKIINELDHNIKDKILKLNNFFPYSYYSVFTDKELENYFKSLYLSCLKNKEFIYYSNNIDFALCSITQLDWDSEQFGFKTAKIDLIKYSNINSIDKIIFEIEKYCKLKKIKYITIRINTQDIILLNKLQKKQFILIDSILTFSQNIISKEYNSFNCTDKLDKNDILQIQKIAEKIYSYDRFHSDIVIEKEKADKLHGIWMKNSCLDNDHKVFIIKEENIVLGYISLKIDKNSELSLTKKIGQIILVGVNEKFRKKGVAEKLNNCALKWFKENNVNIVEVGTQINNIPASRLYIKCGFSFVISSYTLRKYFKN